jgi:Rha family phage regulatory protein
VELDPAGQLCTNTLAIAQAFNKRHTDVLRDVKNIIGALSEIKISELEAIAEENHFIPNLDSERKFALAEYLDEQKKPRPMYRLQRNAFMLLVMGYTGKKPYSSNYAFSCIRHNGRTSFRTLCQL